MTQFAPGNRLLQRMSPAERAALEPHLTPMTFRAGQVFFEPDKVISELIFVDEGVISGVIVLGSGVSIEAMFVGPEGVVGSMAAAAPFRSFARAVGQIPGSARRMDIVKYRAIAAEHPGVAVLIDLYKSQQQVDMAQSVACNAIHRVGQRLPKWLLRCHDRVSGDVLPITQELIGQMLGAQRTTVTELAGDLQRAGLINYHRGQLTVVDRAGLERAACECYRAVRARELEFAAREAVGGPATAVPALG